MSTRKKKKVPKHRSEERERDFWASADSTEYVDWKKAQHVAFPNLKPSLKTISLRLPEMMLAELKAEIRRICSWETQKQPCPDR